MQEVVIWVGACEEFLAQHETKNCNELLEISMSLYWEHLSSL